MVNAIAWPDPASVVISSNHATYETPDGPMHGTTRVLKVLGLSTENLIRWAAGVEKSAALEAAAGLWSSASAFQTGQDFAKAVEAAMGTARQHQKQMQKAAEIGTAVHAAVHDYLKNGSLPSLVQPADIAFVAFMNWWRDSKLKAIRMEQPVWDKADGYAGTIDLIAEHPEKGFGVIDFKTSKGIYDDHHLQVSAYFHAARNFADVKWAQIVRLPKTASDPGFEVKDLGSMYGRDLTPERLMEAFRGALAAYRVLLAKP
jgi:hypothetical protein